MAHSCLYLSKKTTPPLNIDIKISNKNLCLLKLFQIEGVRFLHKQFLSNRGAILNDDSGLGKTVQTIVYLSAIQPIIKSNIVILCKETNVDHWKTHVKLWSNLSFATFSDCNSKSHITILSLNDALAISEKEWQIMVIDDLNPKEVTKIDFNCKFKIWLKKENIIDDLLCLYEILKFISPEKKCYFTYKELKENFSATSNNSKSDTWKQRQSLILFVKIWVLRRTKNMIIEELPYLSVEKVTTEDWVRNETVLDNIAVVSGIGEKSVVCNLNKENNLKRKNNATNVKDLKVVQIKQPKNDFATENNFDYTVKKIQSNIDIDQAERTTTVDKPKNCNVEKIAHILNNTFNTVSNFLDKKTHFKLLDEMLFGPKNNIR